MTYYQKTRVIAKLKRVQNHIKYHEIGQNGAPMETMYILDRLIRATLAEPCTPHLALGLRRRAL